ncbi:MAG: type II toxin-antitoxin system RelE/ParE family toxin [Anaerolineae bacterium]
MSYKLLFQGRAARQVSSLTPDYFRLASQHIDRLAQNPRPPGVKRLKGNVGYSLRVGPYRILYEEVIIYRVKHRREVYR